MSEANPGKKTVTIAFKVTKEIELVPGATRASQIELTQRVIDVVLNQAHAPHTVYKVTPLPPDHVSEPIIGDIPHPDIAEFATLPLERRTQIIEHLRTMTNAGPLCKAVFGILLSSYEELDAKLRSQGT